MSDVVAWLDALFYIKRKRQDFLRPSPWQRKAALSCLKLTIWYSYSVSLKMEVSYVLRILQQNGSTPELMDLKVEEGFIEQPDYIISSHWGWLLFILLLACVALNLAGKGYILWFVNHMAQKRPLNTLITIDQVNRNHNLPENLSNGCT